MDRDSELDAFKALNLSVIASAHGYEVDNKKSTRASVLMRSGADKIVISQRGGRFVYFSVNDPASAGTVIDFAQRVIEPGCSLGRVRQILRPFLGAGPAAAFDRRLAGIPQAENNASEPDPMAVEARYARFAPIEASPAYLCEERAIPMSLLRGERLRGRVRCCPRRGSIVLPHWGTADAFDSPEHAVTGYEIKGRGVNLFSKGGKKGLWTSAGTPEDKVLAFAESGLDALSYLAVRGEEGVRVASLSGQMNAAQPKLIRTAIGEMKEGAQIVSAFDNDIAGDALTAKLEEIVNAVGRVDLLFVDDRPQIRGYDWNRVAVESTSFNQAMRGKAPGMRP
ncbi:hypothetical protein Mal64_35680 [Pseudobythopirellula maris]|uniref:DUF3991 domain-containing protein n=1 Tax=Pseudobythopirellula maris TaxID=2527991 RepID=A0A5C5ZH40_9BACT|nr:toprim domain-containing protein [Pseudobythopirellula maris]TWT86739.1 hypothetical protein Mal64_35680 [Pseudobythopirellula maris]